MASSEAIDRYVRARAERFERFADRITDCHVTVEMPHRHQRNGRPFRVAVEVSLPGGLVPVSHAREDDPIHEDAYAAIDQAFDNALRRLEDFVRQQRGEVKPHEHAYRRAHVAKLLEYEGYGFLQTPEGDEIYFHQNSVLHHAFGRMKVGSKVRFVEEMGDKGPQASTVVLLA